MPQGEPIILAGPFAADAGKCWVADLPGLPPGDNVYSSFPPAAQLRLFEDGSPLGPGRTSHAAIRESGGGRYSHWRRHLYFSASDDSDPNANGRVYSLCLEPVAGRDEFIEQAADYAVDVVNAWLHNLGRGYAVAGKTMCEIGPGPTLSATLVLAGLGADCLAIDREPAEWVPEAHPQLIEAICRRADRLSRPFHPDRLRRCIEADRFELGAPPCAGGLDGAAETLRDAVDLTVSVSVLEHVDDMARVLSILYAITRPGGFGVHWVDFRDHRNFATPLEFLLFPQEEYDALSDREHYRYERGNRVRPAQLAAMIEAAGFFAQRFVPHEESDPAYRSRVLRRLRRSESPHRGLTADDLRYLSGTFRLAKAG